MGENDQSGQKAQGNDGSAPAQPEQTPNKYMTPIDKPSSVTVDPASIEQVLGTRTGY